MDDMEILGEIKKIVRGLIYAEDNYSAKLRTERLQHIIQLVELIEDKKP